MVRNGKESRTWRRDLSIVGNPKTDQKQLHLTGKKGEKYLNWIEIEKEEKFPPAPPLAPPLSFLIWQVNRARPFVSVRMNGQCTSSLNRLPRVWEKEMKKEMKKEREREREMRERESLEGFGFLWGKVSCRRSKYPRMPTKQTGSLWIHVYVCA